MLEMAVLNIIPGKEAEFEAAFRTASAIISSMPGYVSHQLQHCVENESRYILLVHWQTLEAHTIGFRTSPRYQEWKKLLHHFYSPFPTVEHYELVFEQKARLQPIGADS
ncbi:antibiotic biosynthesis monooxygenase family protein [Methylovulum miyakonense]|uniref:antibiotic biosynthesis monooxygenase family protein n=1 Tax=Methylovulum miyakonense TaxID=645578 RepID=UPI000364DC9C|nr:antibiotic biosynthesis monooxygenase [Methylovulum miyakonense]